MLTPPEEEFAAKFIVARGQVFWGYEDQRHRDIAEEHGIPENEVRGGGHAFVKHKIVHDYSHVFGPYNQAEVQKLLPDWDVRPPVRIPEPRGD